MLKTESLNCKNFNTLKKFEKEIKVFNPLNKSFLNEYKKLNFLEKFFIKKKVRLLKDLNGYIGFLWYEYSGVNSVNIESLYISDKVFFENGFSKLLKDSLKRSIKQISYLSKETEFTSKILPVEGFKTVEGTHLMAKDLRDFEYNSGGKLTFKKLELNKDERIRLKIQNEVFKSDTRIPLRVEDIYYDESQEYYYDKGAVFILLENTYLGYGQIIIEEDKAFIVNVGILKNHRNQRYGQKLMQHLMHIAKEKGYSKVYLKVNVDNNVAYNLYKSLGFKNEYVFYNYIKRR